MNYLKKTICFFYIACGGLNASAQGFMGVATGEWNTINRMYLNPAFLGGCHERVTVQLISLNVGVDNSLGTFKGLNNLFNANNNDSSSGNVFNIDKGKKYFNMLLPTLEMRGPSVLVGFHKKHTVAVTTRLRMVNQLNHFDRSIYDQVTNPSTPTSNYVVTASKFNWTAHMWSEIGLSYGGVVFEDEQIGTVSVGVSLKYLGGVGYIGLKGNNMNLAYTDGVDSFRATNADLQFSSNLISTEKALFQGINGTSLFGNLFGKGAASGIGADVGATFTHVFHYSDKDNQGHRLTGSLSVMDLGSIKYKKNNHTLNVSGSGYLLGDKISSYKQDIDSIRAYAERQGFVGDTGTGATKVHLPTAMIIGADYEIVKHVAINITYVANMANRQTFGNSVYNRLCITPRFDTKVFSIGLPITFSSLAKDVKVGLGIRLGGFILGSDDMLAFFSDNRYGINAYFGGFVPIHKKDHNKKNKKKGESGAVDMLH